MDQQRPRRRFRLEVGGMTCPSCEHHVEQALHEAGAADAAADFRRNEVVFTIAGEPDEVALKSAVKTSGYAPGDMEAVPIANQGSREIVDYRMPVEGMTCAD